jgi:hypothetical protein
MAFKAPKIGVKTSVPAVKEPKFVLGSRPPGMRSPRIKPLSGQVNYGKTGGNPISPTESGGGFGNTMEPQEP